MSTPEPKRPSPVNGEFLNFTDGGSCWIGETYETAAIILSFDPEHPGVMRAIFHNRADPRQRRQTCFFDRETFVEWASGKSRIESE